MSPLQPPRRLDTLPSGPVLVFAPHPDDEVIGIGGTLALHAEQGDSVHVVVAFDGAAGLPAQDPQEARETRQREALAGGAALANQTSAISYQFLGFPEGHDPTPGELRQGASRLAHILVERRPTSLYAPWPGDGHHDHRTLARALALALQQIPGGQRPPHCWGYEVWSTLEPTAMVDVTRMTARKRAALACHVSQGARQLTRRALGLSAWRSAHLGAGRRHAEALCTFPIPDAASCELPGFRVDLHRGTPATAVEVTRLGVAAPGLECDSKLSDEVASGGAIRRNTEWSHPHATQSVWTERETPASSPPEPRP